MNAKKIWIGSLAAAVAFASVGVYLYKSKTSADTQEVLMGTKVQLVDEAGAVVKQNVPLELTFNGPIRVCKSVTIGLKISTCKWQNRTFKRVAVTSDDGTYNVSTESYRPLTDKEAKAVANNLIQEQMGRELTADESARLDRIRNKVMGLNSPSQAAVEGYVKEEFKDYTPPAAGEERILSSNRPFMDAFTQIATVGALYAVGGALTQAVDMKAAAKTALQASVGAPGGGNPDAAIAQEATQAITNKSLASTAGKQLITNANAAYADMVKFLATPTGWAVVAGVIILATVTTKKTEKWFTLKTVDVKVASDMYQGNKTTLTYDPKDKYVKNQNYAIGLSDTDTAFYQSAADQLYAKYIGSNEGISEQDKTNYKALLATTVKYLEYARLHSFGEANNNADIAAQIKAIVDNQVARSDQYEDAINLVKNGDFETDKTYWNDWFGSENIGINRIVSGAACKSGKCLSITKTVKNSPHKPMAFQQFGDLQEGKTYRFTASFKSESGKAKGIINLVRRTDVGNVDDNIFTLEGDNTWKTISGEISIPENKGTNWELFIYSDSEEGSVYYDDIKLVKLN